MNILFEDKYILVVEKNAGIPTQAGKITEKDMVSEVNNYLKRAGDKSSAYLIHRLDKPVRGILLFAKTKEAAAKLNDQLTKDAFSKKYYAYVEGELLEKSGYIENYLYKDGNKAVVFDEALENTSSAKSRSHYSSDTRSNVNIKDVKLAKLEYVVVEEKTIETTHICKLDIKLLTGRFHQIRCQLSNLGHPILGDSLYGSSLPYEKRKAIGLIAYSLSFNHPVTNKSMTFTLEED